MRQIQTLKKDCGEVNSMDEASDLTVIDLFCGAGGFTEGFYQAGFNVIWAIDNWGPAVETHKRNHPETEVVQKNIMEIELEEIPEADVVIGSPPCGNFSYAKKGGNGDIQEGLKLVHRFLEIVDYIDPDYWIMENVPRIADYLEHEMEFKKISEGKIDTINIPKIEVMNSADFGTPQRRKRAFSGDFPLPEVIPGRGKNLKKFEERKDTELEEKTLGDVIDTLPSPDLEPRESKNVKDPIYNLEIKESKLTDHFFNTHLTIREAKETEKKKVDHSFYGAMKYPDEENRPSRTVMAMNRRVSRETIVIDNGPKEGYSDQRMLTVREMASLQGYPINYQFYGSSYSKKRRLVGNAVPVTVSFALAREIANSEDLEVERYIEIDKELPEFDLNNVDYSNKGNSKVSLSRSFRHHVPYDSMREFRVDLENTKEDNPIHPLDAHHEGDEDIRHPVGFRAVYYEGYAKNVDSAGISFKEAKEILRKIIKEYPERAEKFINELLEFGREVPDGTTFQAIRSRRMNPDNTIEYDLLEHLARVVDESFPEEEFSLDDRVNHKLLEEKIPVRTSLKLVGAGFMAEKLEGCTCYISKNRKSFYIPEKWEGDIPESMECKECVDEELIKIQESYL